MLVVPGSQIPFLAPTLRPLLLPLLFHFLLAGRLPAYTSLLSELSV